MAFRRSNISRSLGPLFDFFMFFGQLATLGWETLWFVVRGRVSIKSTIRQMAEVGVGSLMVAIITVGFSGAVTALYLSVQLVKYGQAASTGFLVGKSLALEITPVITAIVVAARSGSAMAAEIGSMTVTEQVDALKTMATSPIEYLVVPRVVGTVIMMPIVAAIANLAGLYGGALTSEMGGVSQKLFWRSFENVSGADLTTGLLKTLPFGALIALIGCRQGLATQGGAQGVGKATTSAVVFGSIAIYMVDFLASLLVQDAAKLK